MTSVVVSDGGGNIVEYVTVVEDPQRVSQQSLSMIKDINLFEKVKYVIPIPSHPPQKKRNLYFTVKEENNFF